jgi:5-methylcytosine-specific restriction enzyme subunit McrC
MTIPIRNLYYLFCYAWRRFPNAAETEVGFDDCPDVLNLFGKLLVLGANRLIRRGLDRGYHSVVEETRAPRGKMLMDTMVKEQTLTRGAVVCGYDELTPDVVHNQIIKATARLLQMSRGMDPAIARDLGLIIRRMDGVNDVRLTAAHFRQVQLGRNTSQYAPLLRLCELVRNSLLPEERGAGHRFADILEDETAMSAVFEEFLRGFYSMEQVTYSVGSEVMAWEGRAQRAEDWAMVPMMVTDLTLRSKTDALVIDAKFYKKPLVTRYGTQKIRSGHLYQLSAYMRRAASLSPKMSVGGALIYPAIDGELSLSYELGGHVLRVEAIDFGRPWKEVHDRLLKVPLAVSADLLSTPR